MTPFRPLPPPPPPFAPSRAEQHLGQLAVGYYVMGALTILFSFLFMVHVALGASIVVGALDDAGPPPPAALGWVFVVMGLFAFVFVAAIGGLTIFAGRCIAQRKHLTFIYILAGILCTNMPLGTLLGVLTFVVLTKDDAKALFAGARA